MMVRERIIVMIDIPLMTCRMVETVCTILARETAQSTDFGRHMRFSTAATGM